MNPCELGILERNRDAGQKRGEERQTDDERDDGPEDRELLAGLLLSPPRPMANENDMPTAAGERWRWRPPVLEQRAWQHEAAVAEETAQRNDRKDRSDPLPVKAVTIAESEEKPDRRGEPHHAVGGLPEDPDESVDRQAHQRNEQQKARPGSGSPRLIACRGPGSGLSTAEYQMRIWISSGILRMHST